MPDLKVAQNTARRELLALKQLPTKDMTASQQKIWERLVNPDANGNRLIDVYYDKIAEYQRYREKSQKQPEKRLILLHKTMSRPRANFLGETQ